jgi:hypothetical protein
MRHGASACQQSYHGWRESASRPPEHYYTIEYAAMQTKYAAGQGESAYFFQVFWRIFCGCAAKNRAIRGSAIAPAPARCAVAASRPSYPLRGRKSASMRIFALRSLRSAQTPSIGYSRHPVGASCHFWAWGFASQNPQKLETAGILPA